MAFPALADKDAALTHKTENEHFGSEAGHGVRTRKLTRRQNSKNKKDSIKTDHRVKYAHCEQNSQTQRGIT